MKGTRLFVCLLMLAPCCVSATDSTAERSDIAGKLDEIRTVSYERHWQEAQAMLDELASDVDHWPQRERVEFYLLEARHLALDDRSEQALALAVDLLLEPLDDDQRLRILQFCANIAVLLRDYELAFDYLRRALGIEAAVDDPVARNGTLNMASYLYGRVGEYERAIDYGQRAAGIALEAETIR